MKNICIFIEHNNKVSLAQESLSSLDGFLDHMKERMKIFLPLNKNIFQRYKKVLFDIYEEIEKQFIAFKKKLTREQHFIVENLLSKFVDIIPE